jgi:RNA polymerase sigma-70 factor (ECF subfamily)
MVYRIIINRVKHPSDADDIFQEVFVKAVRFGQTLVGREAEHIKHWLIRVTLQQCSAWFHRWGRVETDSYEENLESGKWGGQAREPHVLMPHDERTGPCEEKLTQALQKLSADHRTVIFLYYYEQLPVRKIAAVLGCNENAVKQRLHNARKKLRMRMDGGALL